MSIKSILRTVSGCFFTALVSAIFVPGVSYGQTVDPVEPPIYPVPVSPAAHPPPPDPDDPPPDDPPMDDPPPDDPPPDDPDDPPPDDPDDPPPDDPNDPPHDDPPPDDPNAPPPDDPNAPPPDDPNAPPSDDPNAPPPDDHPPPPDAGDLGDLSAEDLGSLDPNSVGDFTDDHIGALDPDAIGGLDSDQIGALDPSVVDSFTAEQFANFDPNAVSGFDSDHIDNLDPMAVGGFTFDHIDNLDPMAVSGFDDQQLGNIDPMSFAGFDHDQIDNLDPSALGGITGDQIDNLDPLAAGGFDGMQVGYIPLDAIDNLGPDQIGQFTPDAVGGLSIEQFQSLSPDALGGFDQGNLGGLDHEVIQGLDLQDLNNLDPLAVQNLPGSDLPEFFTNLQDPSITPADVQDLLPDGWEIDSSTGALTAPPGAELDFRSFDPSQTPDGLTVPSLPDFSFDLSLGGMGTGDNVLMGLDVALGAAGFDDFGFMQTPNGILSVSPDSDPSAVAAAFIPDVDNMVQAPEGFEPGIGVNDSGAFVLTTDDGFQIPLLPAPADPEGILILLPGSELHIGDNGETTITDPLGDGGNPIVGIFDPLLTTSDQAPGLYITGDGPAQEALMVYADGSAQVMFPAMQSQDEFSLAALNIPGVEDVDINIDGTVDILFQGSPITLVPLFDIEPGSGGGTETPMLVVEDGQFFFVNSDGDKQEFVQAPT